MLSEGRSTHASQSRHCTGNCFEMHTPQAFAGAGVATIKQAPIPPVQAAGRASHRLSQSVSPAPWGMHRSTVSLRTNPLGRGRCISPRSVSAGRSRPMLSLGHNTVRTIVGKVSGTDRPTVKHLQRIDPDRARMQTWTAKRHARHARRPPERPIRRRPDASISHREAPTRARQPPGPWSCYGLNRHPLPNFHL